ncbi:MAG: ABC-F family ATP-binding cassette domain-containing protein [Lachnospiraceae bacterium]|nr:ABC-F family ATP-binding cassette domain-containing protein [Lachnospiraceae bacterium]
MILQVSHVKKSFLEEPVIRDATFRLEEREKAGLVGNNGAGKSTLFKIISGELSADGGDIAFKKDITTGYLAQHGDLISRRTLFHEVLSVRQDIWDLEARMEALEQDMKTAEGDALEQLIRRHTALREKFDRENGYALQSEITGVLKGLGFSEADFGKAVSAFSGGEKTRIALAKLLLTKPDLLLLDEPTNHLDIHALAWLEGYLSGYPGSVLVISHDRYFLDKLVTKIIDLSQGTTEVYAGNYSSFAEKKKQVWAARIKAYEKQQAEIRHQEEVIEKLRSFNREKSIKRAESREKVLSKIDRLEKPVEEDADMHLVLTPNVRSGTDVLSVRGLRKSFGSRVLFDGAELEIRRGNRVCLIGDNGTGKSTFLKLLTEQLAPDAGEIRYGANVYIGYYDQEHQELSDEKSVFDELHDAYPAMDNTAIRNMLAAFLFTGDDVFKRVGDLSGGEKARLALSKLMLSEANFLILDEPTNHLDMTSREILENALASYEGTVLTVSHDRFFINAVATDILELYRNRFIFYPGNYEYYLEKADAYRRRYAPEEENAAARNVQGALDWQQQKNEQARKRKLENEQKKLEDRITELEARIGALDEELLDPAIATDAEKLGAIAAEKGALERRLEEAYEAWEAAVSS